MPESTCERCGATVVASRRGRRRYCDTCRKVRRAEVKSEYNRRTYSPKPWSGDLPAEEWLPWPHCPDYELSSHGRARSWRSRGRRRSEPILLTPHVDARTGRHSVHVWVDGRGRRPGLASMILEAFGELRPTVSHMACHYDDDPWNNTLVNLSWGTAKENAADRTRNGWSRPRGAPPRAHFSASQVAAIRALAANGVNRALLAKALGVGLNRVGDVLARRTYGEVGQ